MSGEPAKVTGNACLEYVNKPIAICNKQYGGVNGPQLAENPYTYCVGGKGSNAYGKYHCEFEGHLMGHNAIVKWNHDTSKRVCGYVMGKTDEGGLTVALYGNESINTLQSYGVRTAISYDITFEHDMDPTDTAVYKKEQPSYPEYRETAAGDWNNPSVYVHYGSADQANENHYTFDQAIDLKQSDLHLYNGTGSHLTNRDWVKYNGVVGSSANRWTLTKDTATTLIVGWPVIPGVTVYFDDVCCDDPLKTVLGNLYGFGSYVTQRFNGMVPYSFDPEISIALWSQPTGRPCTKINYCTLPYNIVLTRNENEAKNYVDNGTLPTDAWLYPLDWANLPVYQDQTPDPDDPDDFPDDDTPGDNARIIDPNLPQTPTFTPSMLSNYNWYWLTVPEYSAFIQWFWNDIGNYTSFTDIIAKIEGLYNDVASAVLMVRYFPVDISWIGGVGANERIKVGMIEQDNSSVNTINQTTPPGIRDIGNIKIPTKYNSFVDLSPYTQLSVYLPFHGFVDLDIDLLMGHSLYVKAIYDYLTGTIQYLLYYDNQVLINSFVCKMAVDIPITLQTKNDRDSAVFSNVSNAMAGLIGAGTTLATGNPMGIMVGANSLNSLGASAPLNVKGTVGESGSFYAPPQCAIILRRPTIQPSDKGNNMSTWKKNVGKMCAYGYKLNSLKGDGLTVCYTPRIDFNNTTPMQKEIDEIYTYLQEGVIL